MLMKPLDSLDINLVAGLQSEGPGQVGGFSIEGGKICGKFHFYSSLAGSFLPRAVVTSLLCANFYSWC